MSEYTFQGFISFVEEQPRDRTIDHSYTWLECAIGDYMNKASEEDCFKFANFELPTKVMEKLSIGYTHPDIATYGGLADYLQAFKE